ncbi:MAG: PilZ domain-containing protein [Planctomycetota bacterium]|jgi:hypothetical protein
MSAFESTERRATARVATTAPAEITHPVTGRAVPARCRDLSRGGSALAVPPALPVRIGQTMSLAIADAPDSPELGRFDSDPRKATVVRIDRQRFLADGHVSIAVAFVD